MITIQRSSNDGKRRSGSMDKNYFIVKGINSSELIKSLAKSGQAQLNRHITTPAALCEEVLLSYGISMSGKRISEQSGIFIMLRLLKENRKLGTGYFKSAAYQDAAMCYGALKRLRMQLTDVAESEADGISRLLSKPVISAKNEAIIEELAKPYLETLMQKGLIDAPLLFRHLISEMLRGKKPLLAGNAFLVLEHPISPMERRFVDLAFEESRIQSVSRDEFFFAAPKAPYEEGRRERFSSYGSSNELRTILDRIIKSGEPLDSFVIASPQTESFAHLMREYEQLTCTLSAGISIVHSRSYKESASAAVSAISGGPEFQSLIRSALEAGFTEQELPGILPDLRKALSKTKIDRANSSEGKLYLSDLSSLPAANRKNVYIAGLEALAGSEKENAILLDGDILEIRAESKDSDLFTSIEKTEKKAENFRWLIELLKKQGKNITISYSYFDTAALKAQSKPAVFSAIEDDFADTGNTGFFDENLLPWTLEENYMKEYKGGSRMETMTADPAATEKIGELPEIHVSSTSAEMLMTCPYAFFIEKILGIRMPEEPKDRTVWLDPKETGSLCHEIIALYSRKVSLLHSIDEKIELILGIAERKIEEWQNLIPSDIDKTYEIENIKDICKKYVNLKETMPRGETAATEISIADEPFIPGRLYVHGKADLVEKRQIGNREEIYVLDAKTGTNVKQIEGDIETCVQALIYCELLNRSAYPGQVRGCAYLYPKAQRTVSCAFNEEISKSLINRFEARIGSIEKADGWKSDDSDACLYCTAKTICEMSAGSRYYEALVKRGMIL